MEAVNARGYVRKDRGFIALSKLMANVNALLRIHAFVSAVQRVSEAVLLAQLKSIFVALDPELY
jgi:hypothetical protein